MCRDGFIIEQSLANAIKTNEKEIRLNTELSNIFINSSSNRIYVKNDRIQMLKLANTLEIISDENMTAFYNGTLTHFLVQEINENGGNVTLDDFKNYKALIKEPIAIDLDANYKLLGAPLPSSGILVALIMRIMRGYTLNNETLNNLNDSANYYHRLIEAFKHTFYYRSLLGDESIEDMTEVVKFNFN